MVDAATTHYGWIMPGDHVNTNTWGAQINSDLAGIDAQVWTNAQGVATINGQLNNNGLTIYNSPTSDGYIQFSNSATNTPRWQIVEDNTPETGSSAGSNFSLVAFNDAGAFLATAMTVARATQAVNFSGPMNLASTLSVNGAATFGNPLTVNNTLTANGTTNLNVVGVSGTLSVTGVATFSNFVYVKDTGAGNPSLALENSTATVLSQIYHHVATNQLYLANVATATNVLVDNSGVSCNVASGNFLVNQNNAYKPGGGLWATLSDARIKTVEAEYEPGLDQVVRLRPVVYAYKGNSSLTEGGALSHEAAARDGTKFVGLVAQEVEPVFPGMVTQSEAFIDGVKIDDLRSLDTTPLIFALVNAVKELKAEIEALKAARP